MNMLALCALCALVPGELATGSALDVSANDLLEQNAKRDYIVDVMHKTGNQDMLPEFKKEHGIYICLYSK